MSGITDTLRNIKEAIIGVYRFVEHLAYIADTISSIVGIQVIILLIGISIIASGLAAFGIPRGKLSFFLSLILADFFWVLWSISFSPGSYDFIYSMAKTNLVILSPYILILVIKKYWPGIRSAFLSLKGRPAGSSRGTHTLKEFLEWKRQYQANHNTLLNSLDADMYRGKDGTIRISGETMNALEEVEKSIRGITKKS